MNGEAIRQWMSSSFHRLIQASMRDSSTANVEDIFVQLERVKWAYRQAEKLGLTVTLALERVVESGPPPPPPPPSEQQLDVPPPPPQSQTEVTRFRYLYPTIISNALTKEICLSMIQDFKANDDTFGWPVIRTVDNKIVKAYIPSYKRVQMHHEWLAQTIWASLQVDEFTHRFEGVKGLSPYLTFFKFEAGEKLDWQHDISRDMPSPLGSKSRGTVWVFLSDCRTVAMEFFQPNLVFAPSIGKAIALEHDFRYKIEIPLAVVRPVYIIRADIL